MKRGNLPAGWSILEARRAARPVLGKGIQLPRSAFSSLRQLGTSPVKLAGEESAMTSHEKQKSTRIDRRDDVNPKEGEREYGDVEFADPVNKKYPIDTPQHVRSAWSYINHKDNAAKYDADEVAQIKGRIKRAAKKQGVEIEAD
jgi:hypothetical protein